MTMSSAKKRITVQISGGGSARITALCGSNITETRLLIGQKLGFPNPASCRLFNKHGAEIDHLDLILPDDLLYASAGEPYYPRSASGRGSVASNGNFPLSTLPVGGVASVVTPLTASTIAGDGDGAADGKGDHFDIGRILGTGGQGTTYLATDRRNGKQAVLKQIFCAGLSETNKAIEEAMMLSRLKHERVVTYSEVFLGKDAVKGNYVGIVMEYCSGGDLYQMLCRQRSKRKPISVRRVKMWIVQLCAALGYLHQMKVIHRDVKPMNVLLDGEGDLKMADFGLARQGVSSSKLAMTQCGTPGYESPEVQMGQGYDFKTDIWGLGCVVCDMTTLKFMHERPGSLATQVQVDPKAIVKVIQSVMELYGPDLHGLLASMLQADPKRRPSAEDILAMRFLKPSHTADMEPSPSPAPASGSPPPMRASPGPTKASNASSGAAEVQNRTDEARNHRPRQQAGDNIVQDEGALRRHGRRGEDDGSLADGSRSKASTHVGNISSAGEVIVVSKRPSKDQYGSISEALRAATEGMVIEVMEGKYQEELVIDKVVTLQAGRSNGAHQLLVEIQGNSSRPVLSSTSPNALVRGLSFLHVSRESSEGRDCTRCVDVAAGRLQMQECEVTSACGVGVVVRDSARLEAKRCRVSRCGQNGLFFFGMAGALIDDCDIFENSFPGIGMDHSVDTVVKKSRIQRGQGDGIKIYGGKGILLEGNEISHNAQVGISVEDKADPVIRNNSIHDGKSCGISILSESKGTIEDNDIFCNAHPNVYVSSGASPLIRRNKIHHSGSCGVTCVDEALGTVEENDIFSNQSVGVYIMNRANPLVRNNTIRDGEGDGIATVFAARGSIEGNDIHGNGGVGILVESEAEPRVMRNKISEAQMDGIRVCDNGTALIEGNTIVTAGRGSNGGSGIVVTNGSSPTVRNNVVRECCSHGIVVSGGASGVIERNNVSQCASHGIVITRQGNPIVRSNIVRENGGIGIWVCNSGRGTLTENRVQANRGQQQVVVDPGTEAVVRDNILS
uniref:Protein kinase domain-containing protein n=1 Tax=Cryptomonas curvata TaxID=233186 RepID=A0A7S0MDV2_9CRYP|mmetsp:Transcript_36657/g.76560  ORF Transcript_36657/g.76560 Transcript_36657/m.76560 type:complete len:1015 (+) Transcript_36657:234-3278(+)